MYQFILQILIMGSLGVMIYLVARKIPQVSDTLTDGGAGHSVSLWRRIDKALAALPLEKMDFVLSQFLEKNIRKAKLLLMRLDNYLNRHLEGFKKTKSHGLRRESKKASLFEELNNKKKESFEEGLEKNEAIEQNK